MTEQPYRCLEIGPGDCPLEGSWDRMDIYEIPSVPLTFVAQWGHSRIPVPDGHYDLVYSSHAIEHVPWYQTLAAFREVYRVLAQGGSFEVWTVDFAVVVKAYQEKRWVGDWDCGGRVEHWMQSIAGRTFAYEKSGNAYMWHKSLFDEDYLKYCLSESGFDRIARLEKTRGHDHGEINLGFVGYKQ